MKPIVKSLLHAGGFIALLVVLYFVCQPLDVPARGWLGGYGHQLLLDIGVAITLAVSLNLILGMAGQFSLGHAGFLAAGAFTSILIAGRYFEPLLRFFTLGPFHFATATGFQWIMLLAALAGAAVAAILGLLVGLPTLRLRGDYLAIATLGFGEILSVVLQNFKLGGSTFFGGSTGLSLTGMRGEWFSNQPELPGGGVGPLAEAVSKYGDDVTYLVGAFPVLALALLTIYIVHNIKYATSGRALLALRENAIASESVGVPTTRYKVAAFVIGAALAGLAGGLVSHHKSLINPESFRFMRSIEIVAMVILGGQGSITGSILAAIALTLMPEALRTYVVPWTSDLLRWTGMASAADWVKLLDIEKWRMVLYSLFIILSMLLRPQGLFGRYEVSDLLRWLWRKSVGGKLGGNLPGMRKLAGLPGQGLHSLGIGISLPDQPTPGPATLAAENEAAMGGLPPLLQASHLTMQFGGLCAVSDFNLTILPGELIGIIGPNGAGKTTIFNALTGVYQPTAGEIQVAGKNIVPRLSIFKIVIGIVVGIPLILAGAGLFSWFVAALLARQTAPAMGLFGTLLIPLGFWLARPIWSRKSRTVGLPPHAISRRGIARTFQNIRLFANLSVLDNVQIAQHAHHKQGIPAAIFRLPAFYREEEESRRRALGYLDLFNLAHLAHEQAGSLSYGDQRRLEIARALATRPRILLLDEPAAGMNPTEKRELMELIRSLRPRFGLTVLLIEHDMKVIMGVCQRILVLDYGKTIAQGTPEEIRKNPAVIQAYLGASAKQE